MGIICCSFGNPDKIKNTVIMSTTHSISGDQKIPTHEDRTSSETSLKTNANGMILIPQPSDDPKRPFGEPRSPISLPPKTNKPGS